MADVAWSLRPELTVPATALKLFREDIARAKAIIAHAGPVPLFSPTTSGWLRGAVLVALPGKPCYP